MLQEEFIENCHRFRKQMLQQALHYLDSTDDAEDIVQETLAKLWMMRNRIDNPVKMQHLASVILKNASLNMLRTQKRMLSLESLENNCDVEWAQRQYYDVENRKRLRDAINRLSDRQKAVVRMRNVEMMSYADIAKIMGTTESSVRGIICKARKILLNNLKE